MSTQHPWHQVSPGDNSPEVVNAIIEIQRDQKPSMKLIRYLVC